MKKKLPIITFENLAPPYNDYFYFENCREHPFRYRAKKFEMVNAWWLAEAATLVYSEPDFVKKNFEKADLPHLEFFEGKGTECFVAHNDDFAIVAFRGTEISPRQGSFNYWNIVVDIMTNLKISLVDSGEGGKVHKGFKDALEKVWEKKGLRRYIDDLRQKKPKRTIWFTGHSLGAALATLASDWYGNLQALYTFGSPRVGDQDFKKDFHVNAYRFVNNNDIITIVPPSELYHHVGSLKYIDGGGQINDNPNLWNRVKEYVFGEILHMFNALGNLRSGFVGIIPDGVLDHMPTLYAIHIWNEYVEED